MKASAFGISLLLLAACGGARQTTYERIPIQPVTKDQVVRMSKALSPRSCG